MTTDAGPTPTASPSPSSDPTSSRATRTTPVPTPSAAPDATAPAAPGQLAAAGSSPAATGVSVAGGGTVHGVVTGNGRAAFIVDVDVVSLADGAEWSQRTSNDGVYRVTGLPAGEYAVRATAAFAPDLGAVVLGPVSVTAGGTVRLDTDLVTAGSIAGRIVDPRGDVAEGVTVVVHDELGWMVGYDITDADGAYEVGGLGAGWYYVQLSGPDNPDSWYGGYPTLDMAEPLYVGPGERVTGVDDELVPGGDLAVTLRVDGAPVGARVPVTVDYGHPELTQVASTDASGTARFERLWRGNPRVHVGTGDHAQFPPQYWAGQTSSTTDPARAAEVAIAPVPYNEVTLDLLVGATVSGRVTSGDGTALADARVVATSDSPSSPARRATTAADGTYTIRGLAPGTYRVAVQSADGDTYYRTGLRPASPNVTVAESAAVTGIDVTVGGRFADVQPSAPFAREIEWLAAEGITRGSVQQDGSVLFDPTGPVRREAMAAFLYRADGLPPFTRPDTPPFVDVATTDPFAHEIAWLAWRGISTGTPVRGGREFRPAESVSREAMAAFLYRAAGSPAFTAPTTSPFLDVATTHAFYREIAWLAAEGISTGTEVRGGREFRPAQPVSREAMAAFLYRLHHLPG